MLFKNYFVLKHLFSDKFINANLKIILLFVLLYIYVFLSSWKDGSLILKTEGQFGLVNDYANYFYLLSFLISCITIKTIGIKFVKIFEPENNEGIIFKYIRTTNSKHKKEISENLLNQQFIIKNQIMYE